jgi:alkylation response protein AidB-like acyl-CoA dehydrogenase
LSISGAGEHRTLLWPDTEALLPCNAIADIASLAGTADVEGRISEASLTTLKDHGYFGLAVPQQFGGRGANLTQCCAIQMELGAADAGLAIALNMHLFTVGVVLEHWQLNRDLSWALLEAIATQNRLVASAFAEPSLGGSILRSTCEAAPVQGGFRLRGVKSPCSLARRADLICLQAEAKEDRPDRLLVALIPSAQEGIRVEPTWDALGMRSSESDKIVFEDCFIPDELVFHRCVPGRDTDPVFCAGLCWFCLMTVGVYLGLAHAALSAATEILGRSKIYHLGTVRGELPSFQGQLGDIAASLFTLECACFGLAGKYDLADVDKTELLPIALGLKQEAIEVCIKTVAGAMELVGGGAYGRKSPFARMLRDVNAIRFHPPTRLATRQILGRWMLSKPYSFELSEHPAEQIGKADV